jgi:hypothetical protein
MELNFVKSAKGAYLYDEDGNRLIDISILGDNDFRTRLRTSRTSRDREAKLGPRLECQQN